MPYNNTPIPAHQDITGTVSLPLARVKKIIQTDDEISQCSNNAAFVLTCATELFLQYLVEQSYNIVKAERKPRRNIQYRDVANAVARVENLEFLADVVPKTTTFKKFKEGRAAKGAEHAVNGEVEMEKGQGTLDGHMGAVGQKEGEQATNGAAHDVMDLDDAPVAGDASATMGED